MTTQVMQRKSIWDYVLPSTPKNSENLRNNHNTRHWFIKFLVWTVNFLSPKTRQDFLQDFLNCKKTPSRRQGHKRHNTNRTQTNRSFSVQREKRKKRTTTEEQ
ncbi:Hypothetical predicted protein [Octopus vulgaris]|uniref:Uncharacterized protein n=1 Tax=Octopus vulgaris TaxID=6645 RepID=A0AA36BUB8_OCTVU|nr:Hypothetical predicted protein [Octopus vulgaris]